MRTPRLAIGTAVLSLGLALPGLAGAADPATPAAGNPAAAGDPVKPDLGAGPHRDRSSQMSGEGERPRQPASPPAVPKAQSREPEGASTGSSANPPVSPEDERAAREREEDERKATESKDKMKKRPGYKDEVPAPHASRI